MCEVHHRLLANLCAKGGAVLDDPLQLLMNELYTAQTGLLQPLNLPLHQQLKGNLGHKKRWPWTLQGKSHTHIHQLSYLPAIPPNERT